MPVDGCPPGFVPIYTDARELRGLDKKLLDKGSLDPAA